MKLRLKTYENGRIFVVEDMYTAAYVKSDDAFRDKDYDLALEILYDAIKLNEQTFGNPWERADFYIQCAKNHRAKNEGDLELAALTKAIELRGFDWDYQKRAYLYEKRGDYDNAIADYTMAIEQEVSPASFACRGEVYLKKNDCDSALADLFKSIECCESESRRGFFERIFGKGKKNVCAGCLECYYMCGQAYLKKGDAKAAVRCLNRALKIKPDFEKAKALKGEILGEAS
jgi:tetratricopeptide (TPR) repeat protein